MTRYLVRYSIWKIEAESAAAAKKSVVMTMKSNPDAFIYVEEDQSKTPFFKRLITGK